MKIKTIVTEIECTDNELRQSSSLSEAFCNVLRNCFNSVSSSHEEQEDQEQEDGNDNR